MSARQSVRIPEPFGAARLSDLGNGSISEAWPGQWPRGPTATAAPRTVRSFRPAGSTRRPLREAGRGLQSPRFEGTDGPAGAVRPGGPPAGAGGPCRQAARRDRPGKVYPYQFVCFRITDFRSDAHADLLIPAADLKHDLARVHPPGRAVDPAAADRAGGRADPDAGRGEQAVERLDQDDRRWRMRGLVGRRVIVNGRRQLGFPQVAGGALPRRATATLRRARQQFQPPDRRREGGRSCYRARRLARAGGDITDVSRRIARRLGRSAEAVRYTIKNFDRAHPDQALFPDLTGPLDAADEGRLIFDLYRRGIPVGTLRQDDIGRTRTAMYRVINEVPARAPAGAARRLHPQRRRSTTRPRTPRSSGRCPDEERVRGQAPRA